MAQDGVDELFEVRNALAIGNYQGCVASAQTVSVSDDFQGEKDILMYRAMVAQGKFAVVKGDVTEDSSSGAQAVKNLATYLHRKSDRAGVVEKVKAQQADGISMNNPTVALIAGTIFYHEGEHEKALQCLHSSESVDCAAMSIQILLAMNRVDIARKELKQLQGVDEDATVTQLAQAWVSLAMGGEKLQEAFYIFQELSDKYSGTALLLNGQAAALIQQGKHEEAHDCLQDALEKDPNNAETLINSISVAQATGKGPEVVQRYINQLQDSSKDHAFVKSMDEKEADFDQMKEKYAPSK